MPQGVAVKRFVNAVDCGRIFRLDDGNKKGTMFRICSNLREWEMFKIFVEEAAALASITLFVGMIAVWAQVIPQL
jgi:hypothetical protein